jgi:gluconate 2-dehydrogenase gamma chain
MSHEFSRRELLATFAATSGAFLLPTPAQAAEATRTAVAARTAPGGYALKTYTPHEYETVKVLVDYLFPRDERGGSATEAGVPEFMDTFLDLEQGMRVAHRGGLAWIDNQMRRRVNTDFISATDAYPKRAKAEFSHGVAWFNSFRDFSASGYWTSEIGIADLGYMGNVPVMEWTGCTAEAYRRVNG